MSLACEGSNPSPTPSLLIPAWHVVLTTPLRFHLPEIRTPFDRWGALRAIVKSQAKTGAKASRLAGRRVQDRVTLELDRFAHLNHTETMNAARHAVKKLGLEKVTRKAFRQMNSPRSKT